jgi:hypothetical protein
MVCNICILWTPYSVCSRNLSSEYSTDTLKNVSHTSCNVVLKSGLCKSLCRSLRDITINMNQIKHYSPGRALASFTTNLHCSLFLIFSLHPFTFIFFKSLSTPPSHLSLGLPFLLWNIALLLTFSLALLYLPFF